MKKRILITAAVILSLVLAACGSSSGNSSAAAADYKESGYSVSDQTRPMEPMEEKVAAEEAYTEDYDYEVAEATASVSGSGASVSDKAYNGEVKLIYRADVSAETTDIDQAIQDLEGLAESMGGYVEYSDIGNYGYGNDYGRYANYTIRVPSNKYEAFLAALNNSGSCNIRNLSKSTEDIGAEYADTEARLKTLRIKQERLQELLEQAENMEDIIAIENALTDVEYQIEWNSSTLNRYDALVNFSTISIYLQQVARETQTSDATSLGERIVNSFRNGISSFATGFENFLVDLAGVIIPLLIIIAIVVVVVVLAVRAAKKGRTNKPVKEKKKRFEKKESPKTEEQTDDTVIR